MSNLFQKAFVNVLREQPELDPEMMSDEQAMHQSLDKGTDPSMLDSEAGATAEHLANVSKMQANMVQSLTNWIDQLENFSEFLNGTGPDSMQSKLKNSIPDTLYDKIRVAETKKISRVAMEITSLNEMLKGYLASSSDPKYKGV